jgi:hypothetical protein
MTFTLNNALQVSISITNIHHINKDVDLCIWIQLNLVAWTFKIELETIHMAIEIMKDEH